jgi:hypothetical protein
MWAVLIEVDVAGVPRDVGLQALREQIIPSIKALPGFQPGTWLPGNNDGRDYRLRSGTPRPTPKTRAERFRIGSSPTASASVARCEVREVAATASPSPPEAERNIGPDSRERPEP